MELFYFISKADNRSNDQNVSFNDTADDEMAGEREKNIYLFYGGN